MQLAMNRRAVVVRAAAITPVFLIGSFFVGALFGDLIFFGLAGHMQDVTKIALAVVPALMCVIAGGALWGRSMGQLAHAPNVRRVMWAGALGYAPTVILVGLALTALENLIVEQHRGPQLPIHVVFTMLFVPAVFVVATTGALAVGIALKPRFSIITLALGSGLAAGIAFFIVDMLMDAVGYRVGAPGAAERATMLTVLFTGNVVASLAAGAVIGFVLSRGQGA